MARILIVDDSNFFRQIYVKTLTEAGYTVEEAINGRDAVDKMLASPPDLVFLDLVMPVMTGEEVLAEIKKNDSIRDVPVVMLTSISADIKGEDLLRVGSLAGYMTKDTATPQDILNKTHELLDVTADDVYPESASIAANGQAAAAPTGVPAVAPADQPVVAPPATPDPVQAPMLDNPPAPQQVQQPVPPTPEAVSPTYDTQPPVTPAPEVVQPTDDTQPPVDQDITDQAL